MCVFCMKRMLREFQDFLCLARKRLPFGRGSKFARVSVCGQKRVSRGCGQTRQHVRKSTHTFLGETACMSASAIVQGLLEKGLLEKVRAEHSRYCSWSPVHLGNRSRRRRARTSSGTPGRARCRGRAPCDSTQPSCLDNQMATVVQGIQSFCIKSSVFVISNCSW